MFVVFLVVNLGIALGCVENDIYCVQNARLVQGTNVNLGESLQFLKEYDLQASAQCFRLNMAKWGYTTNITEYNKRKMLEEQMLKSRFDKISWRRAVSFDWTRLQDPMVRRQLKFLITDNRGSLTDDKFNEINVLIEEMKDAYASTRICPFIKDDKPYCDLDLTRDVFRIFERSRDHVELTHYWREWHDKSGIPAKTKFLRYLELANMGARMNGFSDAGEEMRFAYEDPRFDNEIAESYQKLQPLYKELFTYVRRKLIQKYGANVVRPNGPLPAHLLGNVWAQEWSNIADIVLPYPEHGNLDVSEEILRQGITSLRMFQMAEEFYTSLGLKPMPPEFWRYSLLEKPVGRKVQCTASAWDFCNRIDYRIKQCTEVNADCFYSTYHEMAHIQYYLYYADQPFLYRDGANPGFHLGIANAIQLSIFNPAHLSRVGLYYNNTENYENNINFLMLMALEKVAYAPFAYLVDLWRYEIFQNGIEEMNSAWWELRLRYQGIIPPVPRSEKHLDAAAKRHIPADVPYMQYYVALLLEFQIHNSLCEAAGHSGPIHKCDLYRSREAGRILSNVLKMGKSQHWREVIKMLSGGKTDKISADAMIKYFEPLHSWLKMQNRNENIVGWSTNVEETALFQPLISGINHLTGKIILIVFCVAINANFYILI